MISIKMCMCVETHMCSRRHTLSGYNEAGHAVRDTGAGCQKSDAHDDFWDSKCVADYGHLHRNTEETGCVCAREGVDVLRCTGAFPTIQTMR